MVDVINNDPNIALLVPVPESSSPIVFSVYSQSNGVILFWAAQTQQSGQSGAIIPRIQGTDACQVFLLMFVKVNIYFTLLRGTLLGGIHVTIQIVETEILLAVAAGEEYSRWGCAIFSQFH